MPTCQTALRRHREPGGWQDQETELEAADAGDHAEAAEKIEEGVADARPDCQ